MLDTHGVALVAERRRGSRRPKPTASWLWTSASKPRRCIHCCLSSPPQHLQLRRDRCCRRGRLGTGRRYATRSTPAGSAERDAGVTVHQGLVFPILPACRPDRDADGEQRHREM